MQTRKRKVLAILANNHNVYITNRLKRKRLIQDNTNMIEMKNGDVLYETEPLEGVFDNIWDEMRDMRRELNAKIDAQSREIQAQSREIQAQSREIQAQSREIQAQSREIRGLTVDKLQTDIYMYYNQITHPDYGKFTHLRNGKIVKYRGNLAHPSLTNTHRIRECLRCLDEAEIDPEHIETIRTAFQEFLG